MVCRTSERAAGPAMQTCSETSASLVATLSDLTKNKKSTNEAITKVKSLAGSSSGRARKQARGSRAAPTDCKGVLTIYTLINTLLGQSLTASITTQSGYITAYGGAAGSCSSLKSSFDTITASLTVIVVSIEVQITTVQAKVQELTGSTASSTVIAAGGNTTSNSSSGRRQQKQWRLHREILEKKQKIINNN